jgi:hypothetical protein
VLEHIPEFQLNAFVTGLFDRADRLVWAAVCCRAARKTFPDGTNVHVTLHPIDWWRDLFERVADESRVEWTLVQSA